MIKRLKTKYPTATDIADGVEFRASEVKGLQALGDRLLYVVFDLTDNPKKDDEWIEDMRWAVRKPGEKTRKVWIGYVSEGFDKLHVLPKEAQPSFKKYARELFDKKIDAVAKVMAKRWDREEREAMACDEFS